jgi:hypothetical protein
MAYKPNENDPFRPSLTDEDVLRQARADNELQPDPELAEGAGSGGKIALYGIAIAVVLGAVFYGLNNTNVNEAAKNPASSTAQNTQQSSPPPSGMRDVTPRPNTEPGATTGAAPASPPAQPPAANPPPNPATSK